MRIAFPDMIGMADTPNSLRSIRIEAQKGFCRILRSDLASLNILLSG
jgi:hypothetical protein